MVELCAQFIREKKFLANVSDKTCRWYQASFDAFKKYHRGEPLTQAHLNGFMVYLRESGVSAISANTYARAINSFLSWLFENGYLKEPIKIKKLKEEQKVLPVYSKQHLEAFLAWKPKTWYDHRLYALICTLIDTGARVDREILPLKREDIDFENLLVKLSGKGNKERIVPISLELRRILYRWLSKHNYDLIFPTRRGCKQGHRNVLRDFYELCDKLGITGPKRSLHRFRHTFATEYLRNGGGELYLQQALGHTTLTMVKKYAQINEQDLKLMHKKTSILSRMR